MSDPVERFWRKVNQAGPVMRPELGPCWQWLGAPHRSGYGRHSSAPQVVVYAHRFSYETLVGPIPAGFQVDHLCLNTMCVRPKHLEAVTQRINVIRSSAPTAVNARKTHCPQGHPLVGNNLYAHTVRRTGTPGRRCRRCNTETARVYRHRRAAAVAA